MTQLGQPRPKTSLVEHIGIFHQSSGAGLPADTRGRYSGNQGNFSYAARSASLLYQTIGGTRGGKR
jgi:hypothetical protein